MVVEEMEGVEEVEGVEVDVDVEEKILTVFVILVHQILLIGEKKCNLLMIGNESILTKKNIDLKVNYYIIKF